ncbi:MAG: hypothetical protein N3D76_01665 [Geminocystis sp.]|nr:hypothetical protein [Geminocystis sp.]
MGKFLKRKKTVKSGGEDMWGEILRQGSVGELRLDGKILRLNRGG